MSLLNWQVNSSSNFASVFIVMTHNSPVNFKLIHFPLWIKGSHQSPNFGTFECSGKNLPNSSCHFWKLKSVFLQILHQYLVPLNIIPLYFVISNIIYFGQRQPFKGQIFEIFECSGENLLNSSCQFELTCQFLFNFCIKGNSWKETFFKLKHFMLWSKAAY